MMSEDMNLLTILLPEHSHGMGMASLLFEGLALMLN
jgi:hypothetical protein